MFYAGEINCFQAVVVNQSQRWYAKVGNKSREKLKSLVNVDESVSSFLGFLRAILNNSQHSSVASPMVLKSNFLNTIGHR